jgi:hypothetical protein
MMAAPHYTGGRLLIGMCVVALAMIVFWAVASYEGLPDRNEKLDDAWKYDMSAVDKIDPQLIEYEQVREIETGLDEPRGIDVHDDVLYVVGDDMLWSYDNAARTIGATPLSGRAPSCVLATGPGMDSIYLADKRSVFQPGPKTAIGKTETLLTLDERAVIVSLAATDAYLFVSDAGNRVVWRFDRSNFSTPPLKIGEKSDVTGAPGLVTPSAYLDILIDHNGLLRVVNPGKLRVETYSIEGDFGRDSTWGRSGPTPNDFIGCCNPVHIAQLPDGKFVTSEKGSPRVKVYSQAGKFECVVAGPESFSDKTKNLDLATDSGGNVYVLDPVRKTVRVFARKAAGEHTEPAE